MNKQVKYFDKLILQKLEQFPRALEGKAEQEHIQEMLEELRILKEAREYFLYIKVSSSVCTCENAEKEKNSSVVPVFCKDCNVYVQNDF